MLSTERFRTHSAVNLGILTAVSLSPMKRGASLLAGLLVNERRQEGGEVEVEVGRDSADLD